MRLSVFADLLKKTGQEWLHDDAFRLSAALSYYAAFSLAPLLLVAIALAGLLFGQAAAEGKIVAEISEMIGPASAHALQTMIRTAGEQRSGGLAAIIGLITLLLGSTSALAELQQGLDWLWHVPSRRGIVNLLMTRLLSVAMLGVFAFLLLVSLVISAAVSALESLMHSNIPLSAFVWHSIDIILSLGITLVLFAMIFKVLPSTRIHWREVWPGAAVTAVLFTAGKFALSFYLAKSAVLSMYGAAGSFAVILLWVYYSSLILYFGAEFTKVHINSHTPRPRHIRRTQS